MSAPGHGSSPGRRLRVSIRSLAAVQQLIPNRGLRIQIVKRSDLHRHSFEILPRRWVVERTLAWLSFSRRLAKDYEVKTDHSRAFIFIASSRIMLKRLTR
jgi:transposase